MSSLHWAVAQVMAQNSEDHEIFKAGPKVVRAWSWRSLRKRPKGARFRRPVCHTNWLTGPRSWPPSGPLVIRIGSRDPEVVAEVAAVSKVAVSKVV